MAAPRAYPKEYRCLGRETAVPSIEYVHDASYGFPGQFIGSRKTRSRPHLAGRKSEKFRVAMVPDTRRAIDSFACHTLRSEGRAAFFDTSPEARA